MMPTGLWPVLIGSCEYGQDMASYLQEWRFVDAFTCQFEPIGIAVAGLLFVASIWIPLYLRSHSPVIPLVLLLLVGGAFISAIAGIWTAIGAIVLLTVGAGGIVAMYARYSD